MKMRRKSIVATVQRNTLGAYRAGLKGTGASTAPISRDKRNTHSRIMAAKAIRKIRAIRAK